MNNKAILYFIGRILLIEAISMVPASIICFVNKNISDGFSFVIVIGLLAICSALLSLFKKNLTNGIHAREGFVTVALSWIAISLFGCLPFVISGAIPRFIDAWFETVSGFTTTGASVLADVESLSYGILYWRSFIIWLGGMGVLVFLLAIIPLAKGHGDSLFIMRAESPGPIISKLTPKLRSTARTLYFIYISLTAIMIVLLLAGGMPVFDSITTAFSTAGTGGFSVKNASIGHYDSGYLQTVISFFMILFGVNFGIYYLILLRDIKSVLKSEELRIYFGVILASTAIIAVNIIQMFDNFQQALHHSFFQVASIISTTGFSSTDFDAWPQLSKTILLFLMATGACAGSTAGGLKMSRVLILAKSAKYELRKLLHPRSVKVIQLDGKPLDSAIVSGVGVYFVLYSIVVIVSMLLISQDSPSFVTTFSSVMACFNNIGPGLDAVGPASNFSQYNDISKIILSLDMLLGRLEIYPMLLIFTPATWSRGK